MAQTALSPPPRKDDPRFDDWLFLLYKSMSTPTTTTTTTTTAKQFTDDQKNSLTGGGDCILHYHSADRDRAVHTGTQPSSTISDFSAAANAAAMTAIASYGCPLEAQIFGP